MLEILIDQGPNNALRAAEESKVAQQLAPNALITHRARGYVLEATANYEEAVREYQAAAAINGNIPDLHLQLGINYSALGIYDQAVQEFSNANALNPADPMPDYLSSRTYATVGEFAKARQYAETAVKDEPTNPRYRGNLGVMYFRTALFQEAVKELSLAVNGGLSETGDQVQPIELTPNSPRIAEIYFTYALALSKIDRCGEVLQISQLIQARIPTDEISVANVAEAVKACGRTLTEVGTPSPAATTDVPGRAFHIGTGRRADAMNVSPRRPIFNRKAESSVYRMFFWALMVLGGFWLILQFAPGHNQISFRRPAHSHTHIHLVRPGGRRAVHGRGS